MRLLKQLLLSVSGAILLVFLSDLAVSSRNVHLQRAGATILFPGFWVSALLFPTEIHGGSLILYTMYVTDIAFYGGLIYVVRQISSRKRTSSLEHVQ